MLVKLFNDSFMELFIILIDSIMLSLKAGLFVKLELLILLSDTKSFFNVSSATTNPVNKTAITSIMISFNLTP